MQQKIYAAFHKNSEVLNASSSGGIFTALSDFVLSQNGIIVGASYNYTTHFTEHIICERYEDRNQCRGSKYIQSYICKDIYKRVEAELNIGKKILYTGTPCQIAAMIAYLKEKSLNISQFYSCDIICHGVGSPGIWNSFIIWLENKSHQVFTYLTFKDKTNGWENPKCIAKYGEKKISLRGYSWLYFSNNIMRPSCYQCCYTKIKRVSDITIGDYWSIKSKLPKMYNPKGTSVLMINSNKGEFLFHQIQGDLEYKESSITDSIQTNLQRPTEVGKYRTKFMLDYKNRKIGFVIQKWMLRLLIDKIIIKLKH